MEEVGKRKFTALLSFNIQQGPWICGKSWEAVRGERFVRLKHENLLQFLSWDVGGILMITRPAKTLQLTFDT